MESIGGQLVQINFEPFAETARLLYTSAFMAERYAGIRAFVEGKVGLSSCAYHCMGLGHFKSWPPEARAPLQQHVLQGGGSSKEAVAVDPRLQRVTAAIMSGALGYRAVDVFDAFKRLDELKCQAELEMSKIDVLLVPTAAYHYTIAGTCANPPCVLCISNDAEGLLPSVPRSQVLCLVGCRTGAAPSIPSQSVWRQEAGQVVQGAPSSSCQEHL